MFSIARIAVSPYTDGMLISVTIDVEGAVINVICVILHLEQVNSLVRVL